MLHFAKQFRIWLYIFSVVLIAMLLCTGLRAAAAEGDCYTVTVVNGNGSDSDGAGYVISESYTLFEDAYGQLVNEYGPLVLGPRWENSNAVIGWRVTDNTDIYIDIVYRDEQIFSLTAADFGYIPGDYTVYAVWNHSLTAEYFSCVSDAYTLIDQTWNTGEAVERIYCGDSDSDTISYTLPWAYRDKYCLVGWEEGDSAGMQQVILPAGTSYTIEAGAWSELNSVTQYYAVWEDAPWVQAAFETAGGVLSENPSFFGDTTNYLAFSESDESGSQTAYTVYAPSSEDMAVSVTLPQASCEGYTFEGWSFGASVYPAGSVVSLSMNGTEYVFEAKWSRKTSSFSGSSAADASSLSDQEIPTEIPNSIAVRYVVDGVENESLMSSNSFENESNEIVIKLPSAQSKSGYYWGGWICDIDGKIYPAGSTVQFLNGEIKTDITFTAMLTPIIQPGRQTLDADTLYYLPNGLWRIEDDETVYSGRRYFYVEESGEYMFSRS